MNAMLVAAAVWMGSASGVSAGEGWSSESDKMRRLGRAEAHHTGTLLTGDAARPVSLYWEARGGYAAAQPEVLMRSLGRAEAWYLGSSEGTVSHTDLSEELGEMRRLCAQAEENPKSC